MTTTQIEDRFTEEHARRVVGRLQDNDDARRRETLASVALIMFGAAAAVVLVWCLL
jgi:hypothetical protein